MTDKASSSSCPSSPGYWISDARPSVPQQNAAAKPVHSAASATQAPKAAASSDPTMEARLARLERERDAAVAKAEENKSMLKVGTWVAVGIVAVFGLVQCSKADYRADMKDCMSAGYSYDMCSDMKQAEADYYNEREMNGH